MASSFHAGCVAAVAPVVDEIDARLASVLTAQRTLKDRLDVVSAALEKIKQSSGAAEPLSLDPISQKVLTVRKRVLAVSKKLASVQSRLSVVESGLRKKKESLTPQVANLDNQIQ